MEVYMCNRDNNNQSYSFHFIRALTPSHFEYLPIVSSINGIFKKQYYAPKNSAYTKFPYYSNKNYNFQKSVIVCLIVQIVYYQQCWKIIPRFI